MKLRHTSPGRCLACEAEAYANELASSIPPLMPHEQERERFMAAINPLTYIRVCRNLLGMVLMHAALFGLWLSPMIFLTWIAYRFGPYIQAIRGH